MFDSCYFKGPKIRLFLNIRKKIVKKVQKVVDF